MELRDKYRIALLSAYALSLHGFEALIPSPLPWLRIGLANIITLTALMLYGFRAAFSITLIRVLLASIFTGTFLGPSFFLSLFGGLSGTLAMAAAQKCFHRLFGTIGISLIGALFHNLGQLFVAYLLIIQRLEAVLVIAPLIILLGTFTGLFNGVVADLLVRNLLQKAPRPGHNVA